MSTAWSPEAIVKAVRESLGRSGRVSEGFRLDSVWHEHRDLMVTFRWRRDPNRYAVRFSLPDGAAAESPWTGLPIASAQEWAQDAAGLLTEELDTGVVRRARRERQHDVVELDWRAAPDPCPPGYYHTTVVLPSALTRWPAIPGLCADFGRSLAAAGLDVSTPRRQYRRGRLLSWLQLNSDTASPQPIGHTSVAWHPTLRDTATLDVLQILTGMPDTAAPYLAHMAVHDAAEAGAQRIQGTCAHPQLTQAGFHRTRSGNSFTVDITALS